ncbi:GbsR/MarR family transcriptional regulator [Streptacidiphilus carbonis]|jgi:predicted transcriptional regulator|uniref:GbsR/MarR family transcriptional regulator n=1 Tax=Streptacidiphilus carbonis TaxID=105422 RepID=UPI0005A7C543|nr:MarR family transcriptional regulator [Streptacidiphilus carbonis]
MGINETTGLREFIERFAGVLCDGGVPRMPSRVFAALLSSDSGRLTSAELAELLEISPAAVSGAVRYLTQVGLATRERDPGSRRDRYRVLTDGWHEAMLRRDQVLSRWESSMDEGVALLGTDSPAGVRLRESMVFFAFIRRELPQLLDRWNRQRDELLRAAAPADPVDRPGQ